MKQFNHLTMGFYDMDKLEIINNKKTKKIVLVGGCFDFIHYGHILFLQKAKKEGNYLVVALESDENVQKKKGPNRPIHNQVRRRKMLEALRIVDEVISLPLMNSDQDYFSLVEKIKPSVIAVTQGDPVIDKKQIQADLTGARLVTIPKVSTPSTSQLAKLLELE